MLEQRTEYPREDRTELIVTAARDEPLTLRVRAPRWAAGALGLRLNGEPLAVRAVPGRYASIERVWKAGDRLEVTIPMRVRAEPLRGTAGTVAFVYGPAVLAGDLGAAPRGDSAPYAEDQAANLAAPTARVPSLAGEDPAAAAASLERLPGARLAFRAPGSLDGRREAVTLRPFAELHYRRYNVYWKPGGAGH